MEYGFESSPEISSPEPIEPDLPEPVEPDLPEPVEPDLPEPAEPDLSEPVEPDLPEPVEPDLPEPTEPDLPEPVEPDLPEPVEPEPEPIEPHLSEPEGTPITWEQPNVPGVVGSEKTEIYHSPETTPEKEPGSGPKPSFDRPPGDTPFESSPEIGSPEPAEPNLPEPVEPDLPEPVEPDLPEPVEPDLLEPVEPDLPELVEPSASAMETSPESNPEIWPSPSSSPEVGPTPEPKGDNPPSPSTMPPGGWPADDTPPPPAPTDNLTEVETPTDMPLSQADVASTAESDSHEEMIVPDVEDQTLIDELQNARAEQEAQIRIDAQALTDRPPPAYMDVNTINASLDESQPQAASDTEASPTQIDDLPSVEEGVENLPEDLAAEKEGLTEAGDILSSDKVDHSTQFSGQNENRDVTSDEITTENPQDVGSAVAVDLRNQGTGKQGVSADASEIGADQLKQDAREATYERVPESKDYESKDARQHYYNDLCGTLGEELAVRSTGGASLDTMLKNNSEIFDVTNPNEYVSVKSHIVGDVDTAVGNYARDLRETLGLTHEEKFDKAVNSLLEAKNEPEQWEVLQESLPPGLRDASTPEEIRSAIQEVATLRVPIDHVEKVHEYLDRVVPKNPELYGIPADLPDEEFQLHLDTLKDRVRPIAEDVTSHDMRVSSRDLFQQRFGKRGG